MNKFIKTVLENNNIKEHLLSFKESYSDSIFKGKVEELFNSKDKELKFIAKNTQWLFVDKDNNLYGSLNKFVVKLTKDEIKFVCEGFRNLALMLNPGIEKNEQKTKVWNEYKKICSIYSLELSSKQEDNNFKNYLKNYM